MNINSSIPAIAYPGEVVPAFLGDPDGASSGFAQVSGHGALLVGSLTVRNLAASLLGTGSVTSDALGIRKVGQEASLTGFGEVTTLHNTLRTLSEGLTGSGEADIDTWTLRNGLLDLLGDGNVIPDGQKLFARAVEVSGNGSLALEAVSIRQLAALLTGSGLVDPETTSIRVVPAVLSGSGLVNPLQTRWSYGSPAITGLGQVIVLADVFVEGILARVVLGTISLEDDPILASTLESTGATAILVRIDKGASGSIRRLN